MENSTTTSFTPLIHLPEVDQDLYLKIEYDNPVAAMKYRAIPPFFKHLLDIGEIKKGDKIAMRSAGSAAVAMAWATIRMGMQPIAVLPPVAPAPIIRMLRWLGCEVHVVPPDTAKQMMLDFKETDGVYIFGQAGETRLVDLYGPVGDEIYQQLPEVAAVTVGIGTGISVTGIARALAKHSATAKVYGCEPAEAPIASGGTWAPHRIPGLAPPIPQPLLDKSILGGIVTVPSDRAWELAQDLAKRFGIMAGPSSGCTLDAALQLRKQGVTGPIVAIMACSIAEYLKD
ncbi:MAG TPA: pyridoxal-phosphate dependent enzyme [Bacteroidetes bacterium]|nr:pyridoxal-phosphate dependent enzyme [Bacteroidota bacterium]